MSLGQTLFSSDTRFVDRSLPFSGQVGCPCSVALLVGSNELIFEFERSPRLDHGRGNDGGELLIPVLDGEWFG
jgi:hypothetical protein